jgi:hypothetical protein
LGIKKPTEPVIDGYFEKLNVGTVANQQMKVSLCIEGMKPKLNPKHQQEVQMVVEYLNRHVADS